MESEALPIQQTEYLGKREPITEQMDDGHDTSEFKKVVKPRQLKKARFSDQCDQVKEVIKTYRIIDGVAPVDEYVQNKDNYKICQLFGTTYSKILNQSNVAANMNKFYILQMLEHKQTRDVFVYFRWGRLGVKGSDCLIPFGRDTGAAIAEFDAKFKEKAEEGNYEELEIAFEDEITVEEHEQELIKHFKETSVPSGVAILIRDIFSLKMFETEIKDIGYDIKKMPLGKLSNSNLKMGYNLLKMIAKEVESPSAGSDAKFQSLSSKFYTFIPHDIGFKKMSEFTIKTKDMVEKKMELLNSLSQMKVAQQMIENENVESSNNKIDQYYQQLNNKIEVINPEDAEYKQVKQYLESTHSKDHRFKIDMTELYRLDRNKESEKFKKELGNRKLLWNGSRLSNYAGILSQGLKGAPTEAPATGFMFGKGIYFSDMSSKCALNLNCHLSDNTGLMLLCDVALGESSTFTRPNINASKLPEDKHSVTGQGIIGPLSKNEVKSKYGYTIPMGPVQATNTETSTLPFNEYVVYSPDQVKMKYLVRCKIN